MRILSLVSTLKEICIIKVMEVKGIHSIWRTKEGVCDIKIQVVFSFIFSLFFFENVAERKLKQWP